MLLGRCISEICVSDLTLGLSILGVYVLGIYVSDLTVAANIVAISNFMSLLNYLDSLLLHSSFSTMYKKSSYSYCLVNTIVQRPYSVLISERYSRHVLYSKVTVKLDVFLMRILVILALSM